MREERRKFARLYVGVEAVCCRMPEPSDRSTVLVQNISTAGMRFIGKEQVPAHTQLRMEISFPEHDVAVSCRAEVIWHSRFSRSFYETGVSFVDLPQETERILRKCLQNQLGRAEEQRRFVRCSLSALVTYESVPPGAKPHTCLSIDISLSGMRALMREHMPQGCLLHTRFQLPDQTRAIQARSVVVWARRGDHELFETGFEFTDIEEEDLDGINAYIHKSLQIGS